MLNTTLILRLPLIYTTKTVAEYATALICLQFNKFICNTTNPFVKHHRFLLFIIKNLSSLISPEKTLQLLDSVIPGLLDFSFCLSSTFAYELFLIKIYSLNANIENTQFFPKMMHDIKAFKGHSRLIISKVIRSRKCLPLFALYFLLQNWLYTDLKGVQINYVPLLVQQTKYRGFKLSPTMQNYLLQMKS